MNSFVEFARNHRRALRWLAGILTTYTLVGFLLVPWLLERQLTGLLQERLQLNTEIESLYLNPFSFYTELTGLGITEADGSALATLGSFSANLQFTRLLLLQVRLNEINVSGLDFYLERESADANTISELAERWQATQLSKQEPEADTADTETESPFPFTVDAVQLSELQIHLTDRVPDDVFSTSVSLDSASIENLSTLPESSGTHALAITVDKNASLRSSGSFSANPIWAEGSFSLEDLFLSPFSTYVSSALPIRVDDGRLEINLDYRVDLSAPELQLDLSEIALLLEAVALTAQESDTTFLQLSALSATQGSVRLPENSARIANVELNALQVAATRAPDGSLDLQRLFTNTNDATAANAQNTEAAAGSDAASPWIFAIDQLQLNDNQFAFTDNALRTSYTRTATLGLDISDLNNTAGSAFPFEANLGLDSGGSATLAGNLTVLPTLATEATLAVDALALNAAAPFLAEFTTLNLQSGELSSTLDLQVSDSEPLSVSGDLSVEAIELIDTTLEAPLLTLPTLQLDGLNYSTAENRAEISEVLLAGLNIRVIINEDGSTNIGRSVQPPTGADGGETAEIAQDSDAAESTASPAEASALPAITLGRIRLENAAADFTDRDLPFEFNANIIDLNANIDNISNTTSELTQVNLEGQVGEFGLMQLETELDPFNVTNAADIDLRFSNIDLPEATPYAIKFAGREVDAGTVDLRLTYLLENQALEANNIMTLNDLVLGEEVEYPDAMDLPLDLALALLKDSNGVIEFEVPVTGELNDPEFDMGPAIRRAITNILTNIVAAPFRLLGSLVGAGDDSNIDQIRFLPGRADIAAPEQQKLLQLAEALGQRPELLLELPLVQGGDSDRLALQTAAVNERIETLLANESDSTLTLVERQTSILENLYSSSDLPQALPEIRILHTPEATDPVQPQQSAADSPAPEFDVIAYNNDLRARLIANEPVTETDLNELAQARVASVREFLTTSTSLTPARVLQSETVTVEEDEEGWLVMEFGLGSG